ncbi:hypothetical protein OUZ56_000712 [Daphnia magna]|uniref:Uncharacterized protein n=1 Tax=Daphnia magna TaxID=35525 RepID=A0ABR0A0I5_9CRUS|nr:hypothetical protein OUZ56_000712 [Daphnia magna]
MKQDDGAAGPTSFPATMKRRSPGGADGRVGNLFWQTERRNYSSRVAQGYFSYYICGRWQAENETKYAAAVDNSIETRFATRAVYEERNSAISRLLTVVDILNV